jgi:hypothetical protein
MVALGPVVYAVRNITHRVRQVKKLPPKREAGGAVGGVRIVVVLAVITALVVTGTGCRGGASAGSSGKGFKAVPDRVTRLVIDVDSSFDEFKMRYEQAVPAFSADKLAGLPDWNAVVARTAELAPHGFLL